MYTSDIIMRSHCDYTALYSIQVPVSILLLFAIVGICKDFSIYYLRVWLGTKRIKKLNTLNRWRTKFQHVFDRFLNEIVIIRTIDWLTLRTPTIFVVNICQFIYIVASFASLFLSVKRKLDKHLRTTVSLKRH